MKAKLVLFFAIALFVFSSCNKAGGKSEDFDYGTLENGQYTNSYFNIEIDLPEDWYFQSQEEMKALQDLGKEAIAGGDEKAKAKLKAAEVNVASLLTAFQYEPGAPVAYNPSIMLIAENIKLFPGIKTGAAYLDNARRQLEVAQLYDSISSEYEKLIIDGVPFHVLNAYANYTGADVHQRYYSTILNKFSFNIIISYSDKQQEETLKGIVNTLKFKD